MCNEIESLSVPFRSVQDNLEPHIRKALVSLQRNKNIIIKHANKGGNTVILDKSQFIHMYERILGNPDWYIKVTFDQLEKADSTLGKQTESRLYLGQTS